MNSSYGSFDFTGGWQDDEFVGSPGTGGGGVYHYRSNQYPHPHAQQVAANAAPTKDDETTTTASPHCSAAFDALSFNHYGGYYCGTEPYLSTPLAACNTSGLLAWDDGTGFAQLSDFDPPPSSFSECDMDYFHTYPTVPAPLHPQSLPLLPAFAFAIHHPSVYPPQLQTLVHAQPTIPTPALTSPTTTNTTNDTFNDTTNNTTFIACSPAFCPLNLSPPQIPPSNPPPTTLSPTDPLRPRSQPLRFTNDLYTPTFVRGEGPTRSGWCGHCASWLTLKDSAYWYHMHFAHGISCATGQRLERPVSFRRGSGSGSGSCSGHAHGRGSGSEGSIGVGAGTGPATAGGRSGGGDWEALCGHCHRWVLLVSGEKGRTAWFRHAYKCQLKGGVHPGPGGGAGIGGRQKAVRGVGSGTGRAKSRSPRKVAVRPAL